MKTNKQNNLDLWKTIQAFPNYEISDRGCVRNIKRQLILKPFLNKNGYYQVVLRNYTGSETHLIHRLTATTFIPNPSNGFCVFHVNEIKTDNSVSNLQWGAPKGNRTNH
jgi:hypothetical protein